MPPDPAPVVVSHDPSGSSRAPVPAWVGALLDEWDAGLAVVDAAGSVLFVNATTRDLLGCRDDEALGRTWPTVQAQLAPVIESGPPGVFSDVPVPVSITVDAVPRRVYAQVHRAAGDEPGVLVVRLWSDDRERTRALSLRSAARDRSVSGLFRDFAHDLKGSLNALALNVALLNHAPHQTLDDGLRRRCLAALEQETQRLAHAVSLLLDRPGFSASARGRVDLSRLVAQVAELVRPRSGRHGVAVELDVSPSGVVVDGHPHELHAAILHLVVNALDAMPDGGTLRLTAAADGSTARVTVTDTGQGVPAEFQSRMWELYATTKPDGTGVGLHVTRATLHAHGGSVRYVRDDGRTTFVVELPLATPETR